MLSSGRGPGIGVQLPEASLLHSLSSALSITIPTSHPAMPITTGFAAAVLTSGSDTARSGSDTIPAPPLLPPILVSLPGPWVSLAIEAQSAASIPDAGSLDAALHNLGNALLSPNRTDSAASDVPAGIPPSCSKARNAFTCSFGVDRTDSAASDVPAGIPPSLLL